MMLISAMIASNLPMTTVFAAAKKQQVKQETKKLEEQSRKMQFLMEQISFMEID